ncbi:Uncharacterised protein [Mycolicibacterium vanbaalenii]|uniref:Uncharacterized protein n=1 Tax=Mycolicibacterium vanbaalenii TaxID=110539 RepID=A0A5S9NYX2_MYCVN|nr:hypothetical protein [Mycolicibacterium vanbaalenii]CAA0096097.1 Uncharacterised protein [Mycolicibacterium vanbaalenii]
MPDVTLAGVLIGGIPSLIVALVGVGGIVYTQRRADQRQERTSAIERQSRVVDKRRELGAEFLTAVWQLAAQSRDAVPDGADYSDLTQEETADVTRTYSTLRMTLDPKGRETQQAVFDALLAHVGTFKEETWEAIGKAEDALIEVINDESRADIRRGR